MDGLLPVNKPVGLSSTDVIRIFKRSTKFSGKIGHAGTLDVFADGLVILMLGKATKQFDSLQTQTKVYQAGVRLGYRSNTLDVEGQLTEQPDDQRPSLAQVVNATAPFVGEIEQAIPKFSAAKQNGQPLYKLARQQQEIIPKSKVVTVEKIEVTAYKYPLASLNVTCSSGTYIRQLTWDIFQTLAIDSFLFSLRRTKIGHISLREACELSEFSSGTWERCLLETA